MIRKLVAAFVTILFVASIHATAFAEFIPVDGDTNRKLSETGFKAGDIIRVTGYGQAPSNWDQRDSFAKTFARQAARMYALRSFVSYDDYDESGDKVTYDESGDKVTYRISQDSKIFKLLEKNARVVDVKFLDNGKCQVTMELTIPADWTND